MQHINLRKVSVVNWMLRNIFLIVMLLVLSFLYKYGARVTTVQADTDGHSHFRFGHITWISVAGDPTNSARITFTAGFRRNAYSTCKNPLTGGSVSCSGPGGLPGVGDVILETFGGTTINDFGDGSSTPILYFKVFSINEADNWLMARALDPETPTQEYILHDFSDTNPGPYLVVSESCCRTHAQDFPNAHINNPDKNYLSGFRTS